MLLFKLLLNNKDHSSTRMKPREVKLSALASRPALTAKGEMNEELSNKQSRECICWVLPDQYIVKKIISKSLHVIVCCSHVKESQSL